MSILIVGSEGSMGRRYQAILRYLGKTIECVDKDHNRHYIKGRATAADGIVIATPTDTHADYLRLLAECGKPILCEKPVVKDLKELEEIQSLLSRHNTPFRMMFQYKMLASRTSIGRSHYDYFRHGSDGLLWDCMQILALARGEVRLGESSPVWRCMINGKALRQDHMDAAYIAYVQEWFKEPNQNPAEIFQAHERAAKSKDYQVYG